MVVPWMAAQESGCDGQGARPTDDAEALPRVVPFPRPQPAETGGEEQSWKERERDLLEVSEPIQLTRLGLHVH